MTSAEARKLDILLSLANEGYNLIEGDKPEIRTMSLGGGYTLVCNIKKPTSEWIITFKNGPDSETAQYPADSDEIVHTFRGDSDKLIDRYDSELRALLDGGVRAKPETPEDPVKQPEVKTKTVDSAESWHDGGYKNVVSREDFKAETNRAMKRVVSRKPSRTIKGLTPKLAECGKIKIGKKGEMKTSSRGNQFRPPEKLDHFMITTMDKENDDFKPDEGLMKKLGHYDTFGGYHCREIPVRLPYDDPGLNFPTSYAYYDSAACQCRGDGELATTSTGEVIECNPETCPNVKDKKCKANGVLSLILDDAPRVGGVYKFRTTGWNSINNIFSSMEFIRGLTNGLLAGLPLMLTLTPKHTVIPGTRASTTIYMVNLEYIGSLQDMVTAIRQTMNTRALMQYSVKDFEKLAEEAMALPEAPEECKAIVEEFYPEAMA